MMMMIESHYMNEIESKSLLSLSLSHTHTHTHTYIHTLYKNIQAHSISQTQQHQQQTEKKTIDNEQTPTTMHEFNGLEWNDDVDTIFKRENEERE